MNTNDMREPFELQIKKGGSVNSKGDPVVEWETIFTGYASVKNLSAREYWEAATANAENSLKMLTRWHAKLDVTDFRKLRILWRGKTLDVKSISNVKWRNEFVEIRAVFSNE